MRVLAGAAGTLETSGVDSVAREQDLGYSEEAGRAIP